MKLPKQIKTLLYLIKKTKKSDCKVVVIAERKLICIY
ncbi:MAG: hypothetical protein ACI89T_000308, partial [Cognaticolwellia sp.]